MYEFTPQFGGFAEELANWPDENFMTPDGQFAGSTPYKGDDEETEIWFSVDINYIGKSTKDESTVIKFKVIYSTDYVFECEDNLGKPNYGVGMSEDLKKWEFVNYATFKTLTTKTERHFRGCMDIPKVIEGDPAGEILIVFLLDGEEYPFLVER